MKEDFKGICRYCNKEYNKKNSLQVYCSYQCGRDHRSSQTRFITSTPKHWWTRRSKKILVRIIIKKEITPKQLIKGIGRGKEFEPRNITEILKHHQTLTNPIYKDYIKTYLEEFERLKAND